MPTRLIVNADDFGLTPGINRAIAELHRAGALTSATLMATGSAFDDAVRIAHELPTLGVGCHIVLVDGTPVSDPASIPTLLGLDGHNFRPSLAHFALAALRNQLRASELEAEITAQIARLQDAGIQVTHLDTHKHAHLFPSILRPLLRAAIQRGVHAIRNPFEHTWSLDLRQGTFFRRAQIRLLNRLRPSLDRELVASNGAVRTTDGAIGISATGDLTPASLARLLAAVPEGTWELVTHPGENDRDLDRVVTRLRTHREVERDALLRLIPAWLTHHPERRLIHFGDLAPTPASHTLVPAVAQENP